MTGTIEDALQTFLHHWNALREAAEVRKIIEQGIEPPAPACTCHDHPGFYCKACGR